jgi:hypothetical protein
VNPTEERVRPPVTKIVRRALIGGGVIGWLVYATVLTAMTLRLPRLTELLAGAVVICVLVLLAAAGWHRITRNS